jgi:cytidylate kinase
MGQPEQHRPIVTLAALYGAGGGIVGPRVAERLGVAFLDRRILQTVAAEAGLPEKAVAEVDDEPHSRVEWLASRIGRLSTVTGEGGGSLERLDLQEREMRALIEEVVARCRSSGGVVLGRGGMMVLRSVPWALHVHLAGPREARLRQGAAMAGIDDQTAARQQKAEDRARRDYVRSAYGVDGEDASLYHLVLDSTALSLDVCVDVVVEAATARVRDPRRGPDQISSRARPT